jgi:predicted glycosyltransferase
MAREAALMGSNAISFFPNKDLLLVDRELVRRKRMFHSRDTREIVDHVLKNLSHGRDQDAREKSMKVRDAVFSSVRTVLNGQ